jgi:hypothetical protein
MSTQVLRDFDLPEGTPELSPLGKRLEILRIERGASKQRLARHAGISRQQLWRVMTGKSELTSSLRDRLALALDVDPASLSHAAAHLPYLSNAAPQPLALPLPLGGCATVTDYLSNAGHVTETLRTLPSGDGGRRLKRAFLNAVEDLALEAGRSLPLDYHEIRRRVLAGEI